MPLRLCAMPPAPSPSRPLGVRQMAIFLTNHLGSWTVTSGCFHRSTGRQNTALDYCKQARHCALFMLSHLSCFCDRQERIFVVHGGLFPHDGVTLNHIRGMSRKREPPIHGNSFEDQVRVCACARASTKLKPERTRGSAISAETLSFAIESVI